jgi:DNA-binding NarL/FixJ family response regulator
MDKIRVFHLEDYQIMRDGVKRLLSDDPAIVIVGEGSSGEQMLRRIKSIEVDVLIMDIYLDRMQDVGEMNGFDLCKIVRSEYPNIKVLAHSAYEDADKIAKIMRAGAKGFVSKQSGFGELLHAVKVVASDNVYLCLDTAKKLKNLNNFLSGLEDHLVATDEVFSKREREVLELLADGKSSKEIGDALGITERTVETHRKNMIHKAQTKNTVELIAYAVSRGIVKK